jgi:8-oxo-dGTP pyrophosphatase MutT (NUDIX family)
MRDRHSRLPQPSLEEMLADPIIWTVMKSDGVDQNELRNLLKRVAMDLAGGAAPTVSAEPGVEPSADYRCGVGIMLLNHGHQVFVGQRIDSQGVAWQMPQGGIDEDEEPQDAAFRELREEIGTDKAEIVAESKAWLRYDLPPELRKRWNDRWRGQQQKWFVMRFRGTDTEINIATEHPEFSAWKWVAVEHLPDLIISFKRQLYLDLLQELRESGAVGPMDHLTPGQ